jgi:outer membrane lipopolysaccharide assembly protein LptE/RlpB
MKKLLKHFLAIILIVTLTTGLAACSSEFDIKGDHYVTHLNWNGVENSVTDQSRVMSFNSDSSYGSYQFTQGAWVILEEGTYTFEDDTLTTTPESGLPNIFTVTEGEEVVTLTLQPAEGSQTTIYIMELVKIDGDSPVALA